MANPAIYVATDNFGKNKEPDGMSSPYAGFKLNCGPITKWFLEPVQELSSPTFSEEDSWYISEPDNFSTNSAIAQMNDAISNETTNVVLLPLTLVVKLQIWQKYIRNR